MGNASANWQYQRDWEAENLIPQLKEAQRLFGIAHTDEWTYFLPANSEAMQKWFKWCEEFLKDWEEDEYEPD